MSETAPAKPFGWRFTSPLMLGSSLNPINSSMIATALVGVGVDLKVGTGTTALLISVLYLCSAIAQPTLGKVSTIFGPRRTFIGGLLLLVAAGLVGALAPSFGFLVVSRALIGIGTSACYPTAMSLIRQRADASGAGVPTRVLGNLTIAAQVTATFGLPLGGILVGAFGWRAIFAVNVPLAIIAIVLTLTGIPRDAPLEVPGRSGFLRALDLPGIALFAGTIASLLVFLGSLASPLWWLLGVFVLLLAGLVVWERRASRPLLDVRMLARNRPLQRTYLRIFLLSLANYSVLIGLSQWLEQGRGLSAEATGLMLLPLTLVSIVITRIVSTHGWVRWPLIIGGVLQVVAGLVLLLAGSTTPIPALVGVTILLSCSAFGSQGNQAMLYLQATPEEIAVASGLYRTFMYLGAIFSSVVLGLAFGTSATDAGLHVLAWVLAAIGAVIALLVVVDSTIPRRANEAKAES